MFAIIVAGRLVQTDFQQVDETKFLINIPDADSINHIVVFMTGVQPYPEGFGGSVYFSWPDPSAPPLWQYLGFISNQKPSAIFKISKLKSGKTTTGVFILSEHKADNPFALQTAVSHVAQIGVSIEPMSQIELQTPNMSAAVSTIDTFMEFANKMLEHFVNYATSFCINRSQVMSSPSDSFVPITTVQQWYNNFNRRLQQNPYFWRN